MKLWLYRFIKTREIPIVILTSIVIYIVEICILYTSHNEFFYQYHTLAALTMCSICFGLSWIISTTISWKYVFGNSIQETLFIIVGSCVYILGLSLVVAKHNIFTESIWNSKSHYTNYVNLSHCAFSLWYFGCVYSFMRRMGFFKFIPIIFVSAIVLSPIAILLFWN